MRLTDFEFDGELLSSYGMMPCSFDGGSDTWEIGNTLDMNDVKASKADKYWSIGARYNGPYSATFSICKNICNGEQFEMEDEEINALMRWLNRKEYARFVPEYEDGEFSGVYYLASFNVELVTFGFAVVGLELTINTNAPFGYLDDEEFKGTMSSDEPFVIDDSSFEIGHIYADAEITVKSGGDLRIENSLDPNNIIEVKNCVADEVLYFNGELKQLTSSVAHPKLMNDFNYRFFRVCNTFEDTLNSYTSNLECDVVIRYAPVSKVGLVL